MGSSEMQICGTWAGSQETISETGVTLRLVPGGLFGLDKLLPFRDEFGRDALDVLAGVLSHLADDHTGARCLDKGGEQVCSK